MTSADGATHASGVIYNCRGKRQGRGQGLLKRGAKDIRGAIGRWKKHQEEGGEGHVQRDWAMAVVGGGKVAGVI